MNVYLGFDVLICVCICSNSKLYRFDKDGNQWKERGATTIKFLKHKETGNLRLQTWEKIGFILYYKYLNT